MLRAVDRSRCQAALILNHFLRKRKCPYLQYALLSIIYNSYDNDDDVFPCNRISQKESEQKMYAFFKLYPESKEYILEYLILMIIGEINPFGMESFNECK